MLEAEGARKEAMAHDLAALADGARLPLDAARLAKLVRAGAADVKALLGQSVPQSRQMLRKVLVGRLPCCHRPAVERELGASSVHAASSRCPFQISETHLQELGGRHDQQGFSLSCG
jgi:hypothetical protein